MNPLPPKFDPMKATTDEAAAELLRLGFSFGDFATIGPDGLVHSVYAHNGERKILSHGPTSADAYRAAVREAIEGLPGK